MMGKRKIVNSVLLHVVLAVLAVIWITPIVWLIVTSFSGYDGMNTSRFFPETWSIRNYTRMLFEPDTVSQFPIWFKNTLVIAIFVCLISTSFVLMVSYAMSCMRFKGRKALMNIAVMLQLFPGFLSMIAIYFILKSVNLTNSHIGMILVYSGASGLGYLVAKGFFDTIPTSLREAAYLEGASEARTFFTIVLPLSKPIIVYTVISSFLVPWTDFVFCKDHLKLRYLDRLDRCDRTLQHAESYADPDILLEILRGRRYGRYPDRYSVHYHAEVLCRRNYRWFGEGVNSEGKYYCRHCSIGCNA